MLIKEELLKIIRSPRMYIMLIMLCLLGFNIFLDFSKWRTTIGNVDEYNKYADSFNGEIDFSIAQKPVSYTDGDGRRNFSDEVETVTDRIHETLKERYYYSAEANKLWWSSKEEIFDSPYTHTGIENYLTYLHSNGREKSYKYLYYEQELAMLNKADAPQFVNSIGTNKMLQSLFGTQTSLMAICIAIIILIAPIFSGEDTNNMDMIILSTTNGRKKGVRAKLISSILIVMGWITILYAALLLIHLCLYQNFSALFVNINWIPVFNGSPYRLTTLQVIVLGYFAYLIGGLAMTMLYCICSAMLKSAILSFVACFTITILPLFFNPNGVSGLIAAFFPSISMSADMLYGSYIAINAFGRPLLYSIAAPALSLIIIIFSFMITNKLYIKSRIQ